MNKVFEKYKDKHKGQRVFIIGNGPSLSKTDLNLIKDEVSFAMNRISLIYDKNIDWRPTYYLFSSTNVRKNKPWHKKWRQSVIQAISDKRTTPFIASQFKDDIDPLNKFSNIEWFDSLSETKPDNYGNIHYECFSTNILERIDKTGTTMNLALQMAFYMGFSEIVFLGADLGWRHDRASDSDPNHFCENYTADIPKPEKANYQMRNIHSLAVKKFNEAQKKVKFYNASLNTVLDVYPIIDYEKYMETGDVVVRLKDMITAKQYWTRPYQFDGLSYKDV